MSVCQGGAKIAQHAIGWKFKRHHATTSRGKSEESGKSVVSLLPRYFGVLEIQSPLQLYSE